MNNIGLQISNFGEKVKNLWIDLSIQKKSLRGVVKSIDDGNIVFQTESTRYSVVKQVFFKHFILRENDVLVDVGCGKARVFNYLLFKGIKNRLIGYEINPAVGFETKKNLSKYKNVTIIVENIFDNFPPDANIFYAYNPFKSPMVKELKDRVWEIKDNEPVILYLHPVHIDVFDDDRFTYKIVEVTYLKWTFNLAIITIAK